MGSDCPEFQAETGLAFSWSIAVFDAVLVSSLLESSACAFPGFLFQWNGAVTVALALVAATAGVFFSGCTATLTGAFVIALTFTLTGVEPAANVGILKDDRKIFGLVVISSDDRTDSEPAERANRELVDEGAT